MENTDLRIGNIVKQGKILEVKQNCVRVLYESDKTRTALIDLRDIEPIELTEEVLLKCGFLNESIIHNPGIDLALKIDEDYYVVFDKRYIKESIIITNGKSYDEDSTIYLNKKITYLHQLQNLYYSLTNKELNYETN